MLLFFLEYDLKYRYYKVLIKGENFTKILNNDKALYIFDIKEKENLINYHKVKERFGQTIENRDELIKNISMVLKEYLNNNSYDFIVYPESSSDFIEKIVLMTVEDSLRFKSRDIQAIKVYKNDIDVMLKITNSMNLQKIERVSHLERIKNMGNTFKINALKATQRKNMSFSYLSLLLFQKVKELFWMIVYFQELHLKH